MDIGGTESMVVGAVASGLFFAAIALVTLVPLYGIDLAVPAETRSETCSLDYGGPAPEGFWVFSGGQRLLNTALFVPAGALLVVAVSRWRVGWIAAPLGLICLATYSLLIELVQLYLARIDRACDITDLVDNVIGAMIGFALGLVASLVLQPWRRR